MRLVWGNSCIRSHKRFVDVSQVLIGDWLNLEEIGDGISSVHLGPVLLGKLDDREQRVSTSAN